MTYTVEETRHRILAISQELFTQNGFYDTQMTDIAKTVGISRTSLYRYYKDKFSLGLAILETVISSEMSMENLNTLSDRISGSPTGLKKLEEFSLFFWAEDRFDKVERFLAEFDGYFTSQRLDSEDIDKLKAQTEKNATGLLIKSYINEGIIDGSIQSKVDSHLASVTIINTIRSLKHRLILRGDTLVEVSPESHNEVMKTAIEFVLHGLKNNK
ncbi:TetR/AcrR family transcriptional regulator [Vibrio cionasavignyae]|uniref:TetR/AcrR family transcriptional regulator n=1 Tax=Vibrio cionasavignyae TaxID=2910252 RepID=UPI003D0CF3AC